MKISKTHQRFADRLRNQRALEHLEEFLGPNWKDVLNFWLYLDTLSYDQWKSIIDAYCSLSHNERQLARRASCVAARAVAASYAAGDAGFYAAGDAGFYVAGYATYELMGSHILKSQGKSLVSLPLFLNV